MFPRHYWAANQSAACIPGILSHFLDAFSPYAWYKIPTNSRALWRLVCISFCSCISEICCQSFDKNSTLNNCQFTSIPDCHLHFTSFLGGKAFLQFGGLLWFVWVFFSGGSRLENLFPAEHWILEGLWIGLRPLLQRLKANPMQGVWQFLLWSKIKSWKLLWPWCSSPLAFLFASRTSFWCSLCQPEELDAKLLSPISFICISFVLLGQVRICCRCYVQ